jgi:hypothetical protein
MSVDPARHEAHDLSLADRLVDAEIGRFVSTAFAVARAANPYLGEKGDGYRQALDDMQHRHLSGVFYRLTPKIVGVLRRAGLLVGRAP